MCVVPKVAAVVLAAGSSRRMGEQQKLLAKVDGVPMISRVVDAASSSAIFSTTVVVGYRGEDIRAVLKQRQVTIVDNEDYGTGLASSLKRGLASLSEDVDGAMILLADMPFVGVDLIDCLVSAFVAGRGQNIIVPGNSERHGNPVVWPVRFFPQMMKLDGDTGARALLKKSERNITTVTEESGAAFFDVDTPAELERANLKFDAALPKN